ncbi:TPA: hypothetical protein U1W51_000182 [Streptococcus suis]|nr:hypothetical protein [Streptococcus suis]HEM4136641.1 hypothetical protein [Streptococcus suis]
MKIRKNIATGLCLIALLGNSAPTISGVTVFANASITSGSAQKVTKDGVRLYVVDGKIYELPENSKTPSANEIQSLKQSRGKWTAAIKAIRKGYSKLPANVKSYINRYIGLNALLSTVEHFTGWLEDGIYQACRKAGMPNWMARLVAKSVTFLAF